MWIFRLVLLGSLALFSFGKVWGQFYNLQGTATAVGQDCYQLTDYASWQHATLWNARKIDITSSFDMEFTMNFGGRDLFGADGMVFVLQTYSNTAIGIAGQGIGFKGFAPSLGIEFDTYQNLDEGDPDYDHIGILRDGNVDHLSPANLMSPVQASAQSPNIEDENEHRVRIRWIAPRRTLEVYFDCSLRVSQVVDMAAIFGKQTQVYWGFAGATGGSGNRQIVCLKEDIVQRDTFRVCTGETLQLLARDSPDAIYAWSPAALVDNATIRTPQTRLAQSQLFTVEYRDFCNTLVRDSMFVQVADSPVLGPVPSPRICLQTDSVSLTSRAQESGLSYYWPHSGETQPSVQVGLAGRYELEVTKEATCTVKEIFDVTTDCEPLLWVPDAFSPNADRINDRLALYLSGPADIRFRVYDRWGNVVFSSEDSQLLWDGFYLGTLCPPGAYTWKADYRTKDKPNAPFSTKTGVVWLLR